MKLLCIVITILISTVFDGVLAFKDHPQYQQFKRWQAKHGKDYDDDSPGCAKRFKYYLHSVLESELLNTEAAGTAFFAPNHMADMSEKESNTLRGFKPKDEEVPNLNKEKRAVSAVATLPMDYWNWCDSTTNGGKNYCSAIKDQGQCGSCWAYTSTTVLESSIAIQKSTLTSLAPQQFIDCYLNSTSQPYGCDGGPIAFDYAKTSKIVYNTQYPDTSAKSTVVGTCQNPTNGVGSLSASVYVPLDEAALANALIKYGPIAIMLSANPGPTWNNYASGVLKASQCGTTVNHAVTLVGFDNRTAPPSWIIRNSWGSTWGNKGYIYVEYGTNACGLITYNPQAISVALFTGSGPVPVPVTPTPITPTPKPTPITPTPKPTPISPTPVTPSKTCSQTATGNCEANTGSPNGYCPCVNPPAIYKNKFTTGVCSPTNGGYFCFTKISNKTAFSCQPTVNVCPKTFYAAQSVDPVVYSLDFSTLDHPRLSNAVSVDDNTDDHPRILPAVSAEQAHDDHPRLASAVYVDEQTFHDYPSVGKGVYAVQADAQTSSSSDASFMGQWIGVGLAIGVVGTLIVVVILVVVINRRKESRYI